MTVGGGSRVGNLPEDRLSSNTFTGNNRVAFTFLLFFLWLDEEWWRGGDARDGLQNQSRSFNKNNSEPINI